MTERSGEPADVALLLEGTYPYVRGGVSTWVHNLIESLSDTTFSIVFIGGRRTEHGSAMYRFPPNVVNFERHYLFEPRRAEGRARFFGDGRAFQDLDLLLEHLRANEPGSALDPRLARRIALSLGRPGGLSSQKFLHGDESWEWITDNYRRDGSNMSFTDYFWTMRATHIALFALADIAANLPPARFYHSLCTGYAGFLGALLAHQRKRPLIVTEHGIYTKERMIDLASADAFPGDGAPGTRLGGRQLWMRFFQGLGKMAYSSAHAIVSLYEGNRQRQLDDGADPARTRIIPNGVEIERFAALRDGQKSAIPPVLGFVGRVVPIKDVKTFIRAMKAVVRERPDSEGFIVGPTSEDPGYANECAQLVSSLGLGRKVKFLGFRPPEEILRSVGLVVLTSMSEALPLVLLEAFASGVPAVATDVGACRELIEGRTPADRSLGAAGAVVPVADPEAVARAALALLHDPVRWKTARKAAIRRVEAHYTQTDVIEAYRQLYREAASWRA